MSPDFVDTPYLYPLKGNEKNIVKIKLTGDKLSDKKLANALGGHKRIPKDYTWHHLDDYTPINNTCTMQLVETFIHRKCSPHIGSVKIVEEYHNIKYLNR